MSTSFPKLIEFTSTKAECALTKRDVTLHEKLCALRCLSVETCFLCSGGNFRTNTKFAYHHQTKESAHHYEVLTTLKQLRSLFVRHFYSLEVLNKILFHLSTQLNLLRVVFVVSGSRSTWIIPGLHFSVGEQ